MSRTALLFLLLALCSCGISAAPVPLPKQKKEVEAVTPHVGTWDMAWKGGTGRTTFHKEGGYQCRWNGDDWQGSWVLKGGVLTVTEWIVPMNGQPPRPSSWSVTLDATKLAGSVDGEQAPSFRLTVPKPDA